MVTRAAVAIHAVLVNARCGSTPCTFPSGCVCANDAARAAIEAMREPNDEMRLRGMEALYPKADALPSAIYMAMIGAALSESQT